MKKIHDELKSIYGPKSSGATTLLSADGSTLLTDGLQRDKMYLRTILSIRKKVTLNV